MIEALKAPIRRHWPRLRLRTILLLTFVAVAALPGFGALFLRVYENTLVRQTEAELVAQGAALAAVAAADWPGAKPVPENEPQAMDPDGVAGGTLSTIDLRTTPILPERPDPVSSASPPRADALAAAGRLTPILRATSRTTLASILLLDAEGRILTGPNSGESYAALPEVADALHGDPDTVLRRNGAYRQRYALEWLSRASDLRIHHARPVIVEGHVVGVLLLSRSPRALFRGLYEDRGKILLGIGLIFAALVVLSGLLSRGIARPIEALSEATRQVALGGGGVPQVPPTAAIEIQALYADFARMADAIARRSLYLRDFAHAVSHEFKTPLAGIRGAIEILEDHGDGMSEADRRRFQSNIAADADRLALLVTRLLELARADMAGGVVPADTELAPILHHIADAYRADRFAVVVEVAGGSIAGISPAVLETVLVALIDNARQAGAGQVRLVVRWEEETVALDVIDDGPGIPIADRARIFEPFFTSRRADGGTGLGLPIVRSLLASAGATIALRDADSGTRFTLGLRAAG
ncbi:sensor histidine kinase [Sphingomonas oryzagri]|uniref:histidine kinase n=1 Tax=Sphingomonas oryzagri TaxID=3042314 RepID=A0ABT6N6L4_9SPHN|nr:HAMP domain-containing sensor histidine kinase [Sphingomonas oryzagri]MDH7640728.1 HAMP domain-containing sensor histidine kinase [Sphingomonas oryzagri]